MEPHYNVPVVSCEANIYVYFTHSVIVEYGQVATRSAREHPMERMRFAARPTRDEVRLALLVWRGNFRYYGARRSHTRAASASITAKEPFSPSRPKARQTSSSGAVRSRAASSR